IPNGIDPIRFAPAPDPERARVEAGLDRETVLFLGRLDGQKGLETALAAWTQVTARRPTARLSIAGDGPLRPVLEARARELGLGNTVQFLGLRPDPERLLRASQVFMLPSRSEGMSNSLLGAMATGVGCVATRVGGNSELLEHGVNGLLIPPGDAVALAEAVVAILEDTALARRLGMAARATVMERYRMDRIVRQYADLYSAVVGGLG
ncbi:MAG TPA: glycosyltransferase, partial [Candidatus Methylomirabilis sp.]|nr:glycosyltransferase [Candidatus Methylomirabilis sp.]